MCGIVGFISKSLGSQELRAFAKKLNHRGPDSFGCKSFESNGYAIGLGHTRLSILDLSEQAAQPYTSQNEHITLTYNGEIYNFRELKKDIKHQWKSISDTEVLCEGLSIFGTQFLHQVYGMFAFAAWDKQLDNLVLARDRVGIKPLYYFHDGKQLAFASEIKAFSELSLPLTINHQAIYDFLHLGYIPSRHTIYNEIKKVLPGEVLTFQFREDHITIKKDFYWKAEKEIDYYAIKDKKQGKKGLSELLYQSVERHLVSDVEVGSFLSGGIDSSLVTAIAQKINGKNIKTFSIGFDDHKFNELSFANQVASHLHTDHYQFVLKEQDALEKVDNLLNVYDEPFADSSAIPTLLVSEMASKHVKVALSGDGGDELFLGYGMHNWADRLNNPFIRYGKPLIQKALSNSNNWNFIKGSMMLNYNSTGRIRSHIFSQEQQFFAENELKDLLVNYNNKTVDVEQNFPMNRNLSSAEQQAFFDLKYYLPDDLLVKVDRASMHHSLEVRVPLLDHTVLTYALNLDRRLKLINGERKWLLKTILYDHVPKHIFNRPKKGFSIPLKKWLKTDLKFLVDKYLSKELVEHVGILNSVTVFQLLKKFESGEDYLYNKIWQLILLQKWFIDIHR